MNQKGNTKRVESADLKRIIPIQELGRNSLGKSVTRHWGNLPLILPPDEYVLFGWLTFMSSADNSLKYSTLLLKQFKVASLRYNVISETKNKSYNSGLDHARDSFINLIEKGYLIKSYTKNVFIINWMVVYNSNHRIMTGAIVQRSYLEAINNKEGIELTKSLTDWAETLRLRINKNR